MAPCTGRLFVRIQVWPPSFAVAVSAALFEARSPPPMIPLRGLRKATEIAPALGELTSGVSYAFQLLPPSRVARILATDDAPASPPYRRRQRERYQNDFPGHRPSAGLGLVALILRRGF